MFQQMPKNPLQRQMYVSDREPGTIILRLERHTIE